MMSRFILFVIYFIGLSASTHAAAGQYTVETVADRLDYPWSAAFLPGGDILVTELSGNLRRISDGNVGNPIENVPPVFRLSQGGLFDVVLDPDFVSNQTLYLSYAAGDGDHNGTVVSQARLEGNKLADVKEIFSATPKKYAPLHYGGRLAWTLNGNLLVTTGDGFDFREKAQDLNTHFGKTIELPIHAPNAPMPFTQAPLVLSYGHRNPQGLAVSKTGTIYQHEHGPRGGDEVNVITAGANYGWPAITYGIDYNGAYVSPFTEHPNMTQPLHIWVPSIAPSGLMIYEGDMFPEWQGDLFVGALVDEEVRRLDMHNGQVVAENSEFPEVQSRIRVIREAPDGSIYIITDGNPGSIVRISR